ncbi:hypothetical protein PFNF54_02902 [Plasmodium falciparum NF54]|uniref:Uncharacterized protein n=1 Tax=Plasmodium falciparum (isolate NF54) TaxID=5843 RepID=W7JUA6_PLAFO|nr:hypothetical protein PFNF54_02902 [Plasmodium falciparum NF54]
MKMLLGTIVFIKKVKKKKKKNGKNSYKYSYFKNEENKNIQRNSQSIENDNSNEEDTYMNNQIEIYFCLYHEKEDKLGEENINYQLKYFDKYNRSYNNN